MVRVQLSRGKMPLANDRDPSGVKPRDLSLTTGPQIGKLFLARSQNVRNDASEARSQNGASPIDRTTQSS